MSELLDLIDRMYHTRAFVVGDALYDKYVFGRVERICPEAPVPVFIPEETKTVGGGAWHVADQIEALCGPTYACFGSPISVKTRYQVGAHLVLRVDEDKCPLLQDEAQRVRIFKNLVIDLPNKRVDVVVLSDYDKGWLTEAFCQFIIKWAVHRGIPVVVDPKKDWAKFEGCTLICPNQGELDRARRHNWPGDMLIKRGERGLHLSVAGATSEDFPATARHVYNVTGAGDTVTAVAAVVLGARGTLQQAAILANLAAGWCVGEIGTAVCSRDKLIELVRDYEREYPTDL